MDINYYIAFITSFIGNALVIIISMNVTAQEIRAYSWIISFQAAVEITVCTLNSLIKYVSFIYKTLINHYDNILHRIQIFYFSFSNCVNFKKYIY